MNSLQHDDQLTTVANGVRVGVVPMNGQDVIHHAMFNDALYTFLEAEATAHETHINGRGFDKVLNAIRTNKIQAHFLVAEWESCRRKVVGGAIEFPTVITEWDGQQFNHYPAIYGEDTYVAPEMSKMFRNLTASEKHPKGLGLGTFFIHERIRQSVKGGYPSSPNGMIARGRVAEVGADNASVANILQKVDSSAMTEDNMVVELNKDSAPPSKLPIKIEELVVDDGSTLPFVFLASWSGKGGKERIVASFTEAISTFSGETIVRVQLTSNGNLPPASELKQVVDGLLSKGQDEIVKRNWLSSDEDTAATTSVPMRIHALREPKIVQALRDVGCTPRSLGTHPMLPVITNLGQRRIDALEADVPPATKLNVQTKPNRSPDVTEQRFPISAFG